MKISLPRRRLRLDKISVATWLRLRHTSCTAGFESQAHRQGIFRFILLKLKLYFVIGMRKGFK